MSNDNFLGEINWNQQGLVPAIAQDFDTGDVLMMAWMNAESLACTVREGRAVYYSRSRDALWHLGYHHLHGRGLEKSTKVAWEYMARGNFNSKHAKLSQLEATVLGVTKVFYEARAVILVGAALGLLVASGRSADPFAMLRAAMGGGTSLVAIGEQHIDAAALVLVDMAPRLEPSGTRKIQEFMNQKPEGFDSLEEVAEAISNYQPHRKRPRKLDGLAKNVRLGDDGKYHWHWDPARRNTRRMSHYIDRLSAAADNLTLPTLLVRGGLSDVLTEEGAQSFLQQCPHAEYVNVQNAAHMVAGDRNDIFSDAVIEFLKRTVPPN